METRERINDILVYELGIDYKKIIDSANLRDDLGADSFDKIGIIMQIEDKFNISIKDEHAEKMITVGNIFEYLKKEHNII